MAQGVELGVAYISIIPTTERLAAGIRQAMGQVERDATQTGQQAGQNMGDGMASKMKVAAAAIGVAAGALITKGLSDALAQSGLEGKMQASLGLSPKQAKTAGKAAGSLFSGAYGDSVEQVSSVV